MWQVDRRLGGPGPVLGLLFVLMASLPATALDTLKIGYCGSGQGPVMEELISGFEATKAGASIQMQCATWQEEGSLERFQSGGMPRSGPADGRASSRVPGLCCWPIQGGHHRQQQNT